MKRFVAGLIAFGLASATIGVAADQPMTVGSGDTVRTVLAKLVGKKVALRMKDGGELAGTVKTLGNHMVHLGALREREFFDAAVELNEISAVIVRTRDR